MANWSTAIPFAILLVCLNFSVALSQRDARKYHVTASCLTEIRDHRKSCWGIIIKLDQGRFKKRIQSDDFKLFEAKHGADLRNLMSWQTSHDGKQLRIRFKPGMGDFGTGNQAEITLYKTAFALTPPHFPGSVVLQRTDLR